MMQGEPLLEGCASPVAQAKGTVTETSAVETAQKTAEPTLAEDEVHDPTTAIAGETEVPARQTSPGTSFVRSFLLWLFLLASLFV